MFGKITAVVIAALFIFAAFILTPSKINVVEAAGATVTLTNFQFAPKSVRIRAGEAVTWTSKEGSHTVTADDNSFDSGTISAGKSFSHTFNKAGTYKYYCSLHGSTGGHDMAGTVVVTK
jgi:plastocyanin